MALLRFVLLKSNYRYLGNYSFCTIGFAHGFPNTRSRSPSGYSM